MFYIFLGIFGNFENLENLGNFFDFFTKKIFTKKNLKNLTKKWSKIEQKIPAPNFFYGSFDPPNKRHFGNFSENRHFSKKKREITELSKNHLCRFSHLIRRKKKISCFLETCSFLGGFLKLIFQWLTSLPPIIKLYLLYLMCI